MRRSGHAIRAGVQALRGRAWQRLGELVSPLTGLYAVCVIWLSLAVFTAIMVAVRGLSHAGIFQLIALDETPRIQFLFDHYAWLYWFSLGLGLGLLLSLGMAFSPAARARRLAGIGALTLSLIAWLCRYQGDGPTVTLVDLGPLDWLLVVLLPMTGSEIMRRIEHTSTADGLWRAPVPRLTSRALHRPALVYLLSTLSIVLYVIPKHLDFWQIRGPDGEPYTGFLAAHEIVDSQIVLYTTSVLFASLVGVLALIAYLITRRVMQRPSSGGSALSTRDCKGLAGLLGTAWATVASLPWLHGIWPEVVAEHGQVFAAMVVSALISGLVPLFLVCLHMVRRDVDEASQESIRTGLVPTEYAFIAFCLAPIYPCLRLVRPRGMRSLAIFLGAASAGLMLWLAWKVDTYEVDGFDFRDMIRKNQIPFMRITLSLAIAWLAYISGQRVLWLVGKSLEKRRGLAPDSWVMSRPTLRLIHSGSYFLTGSLVLTASLPLWYWQVRGISQNTYARCVEHSLRHEYELSVMHALFDFDGDGYSALLHGGDTDDFDASITATGFAPLVPADLPVDTFEVHDGQKAGSFPSVLLLTLEGVNPQTISAYGKRQLAPGRVATPNLDAIAAESTLFSEARSVFPSTWDAWMMITSGRFIRVTEMDTILSFGDRYSRHNNLIKILEAAGIRRWCHANAPAHGQIVLGPDRHTLNWENEYTEEITDEEHDQGVYRGDKNLLRVRRFLDSLEPDEKFFISEHMSDTHFPWYLTPRSQAVRMGHEGGLFWAEADGMQHDEDHLNYLQEVTRMDWQVGQMIEDLKARGLYEDTVIIIVGDHGCQWLEHGHKYYPGHLYDPALRIPLMIRIPQVDGGGRIVDVPATHFDILTTLAELSGVTHSNEALTGPLPGCSLVPFLEGTETAADRSRCTERDLLLTTRYDMVGTIVNFETKLIVDRITGTYFLFDLTADPEEKHNLVDSEPELFQAMLENLREQTRLRPGFLPGLTREE